MAYNNDRLATGVNLDVRDLDFLLSADPVSLIRVDLPRICLQPSIGEVCE